MRATFTIILFVGTLLLLACGEQPNAVVVATEPPPQPNVVIIATEPPLPQPQPQPTAANEAISEEAVSQEAVTQEAVVGGNGRSLTIWADELRTPALETAAAAFAAANDGLTVVVEQRPLSDIRLDMLAATAAAAAPDIIVGSHTWVGELVGNGVLAPVNLGEQAAQFVPVSLEAFTNNGALYGMPNSTDNVAFFINQDLVPDCPTSWSEVLDFSRARAAGNTEDIATNLYGFVRMEGSAYHFFPIQSAFGGTIFGGDNGRYDVTDIGLDGAGSVAAADYYDTFLAEGLQPGSMDMDTMRVWFETGKAAMIIIGPWALGNLRDADVNYKICDIPSETAPGRVLVEAQGFMITTFSDDPELAQLFLTDFVATPETMQAIADVDFRLSAYLPVRSSAGPDLLAIGEVGAKGTPIPGIPEMAYVWEPWETAVTLLSRQQATPEEAFVNAATQIRAAILNNN